MEMKKGKNNDTIRTNRSRGGEIWDKTHSVPIKQIGNGGALFDR